LPQQIGYLLRKACPALLRRFNAIRRHARAGRRCSANEAREELVRNRGTQFDPNVVDAILAVAA
jgi:response regulator RpfG family c-di-GMP phosphodiesterase